MAPVLTRREEFSPVQRPMGLASRMDFRGSGFSTAAAAGFVPGPQLPAGGRSSSSNSSVPSGCISMADHESLMRANISLLASVAATAAVQTQQQVSSVYKKRERVLHEQLAEREKAIRRVFQ